MPSIRAKPPDLAVVVAFVLFLLLSGCGAMLLLGAGGAGGYLIRKGEEEKAAGKQSLQSRGPDRVRLARRLAPENAT
jgi:hypothetical protein